MSNKRVHHRTTEEGVEEKMCGDCGLWKDLSCFNKRTQRWDGLLGKCKDCHKIDLDRTIEQRRERERKKKPARKIWLEETKEARREYYRKYTAEYRKKNKDRIDAQTREYFERNRERINKRVRDKRRNDPNTRIKANLRSRANAALKGKTKSAGTMELLGCTIDDLWVRFEKMFKPGMTQKNYGKWHMDHIVPCDFFDFEDEENQKICFHYVNLRPLWGPENISKSNKVTEDMVTNLMEKFDDAKKKEKLEKLWKQHAESVHEVKICCRRCGIQKSSELFEIDARTIDGLSSHCIECTHKLLTKVEKKVCSGCKVEKSYAEFGNNRRSPDGLKLQCKVCLAPKIAADGHKICKTCKLEVPKYEFRHDGRTVDGLNPICDKCHLICNMCGIQKTREDFHLNNSSTNGLQSSCKTCQIQRKRIQNKFQNANK